jgi:hypothetical protein
LAASPLGRTCAHRTIPTVLIAVAVAALAGCGARPWWYSSGESGCGLPGLIRADGHVSAIGNCAGELSRSARTVSVRVGAEIDVHMTPEGTSAGTPDVPLPTSTNSEVLRATDPGGRGPTTTYRAVGPGKATLMSTTIFCTSDHTLPPTPKPCPVIDVIVSN